MSNKKLSIDEMLDALRWLAERDGEGSLDERLHELKLRVEDVADDVATELANALDIESGVASSEERDFGGTLVPFWPKAADQPVPEVFEELGLDPSGDWEPMPDLEEGTTP